MTPVTAKSLRVYADTSVYGGVFDEEFAAPSRRFFEYVHQEHFRLVVSVLSRNELEQAPPQVREWFGQYRVGAGVVDVTPEALALQRAYLDAGIVTLKSADDALHVALATVASCAMILSWNFRHIVHYQKMPLYNAVNVLRRYPPIEIHSPSEVIEEKTKTFDCVEMKRQGAQRVQAEMAGMTAEQQVEYWRRRSEDFRHEQERLRTQAPATADAATPTTRQPA